MIFVARRGPVAGCQTYCVGEKGGVRCARNMRPIGQLETEEQARVFADYLYVRDIAAEVEDLAGEAWRVWVVDEDRVARLIGPPLPRRGPERPWGRRPWRSGVRKPGYWSAPRGWVRPR